MKLVIAVVRDHDAGAVIDALVAREYRTTRINTQGGFLKRGNATILVGVEDEKVADVTSIVRATAQPTSPTSRAGEQGAGTVFVLDVARFVRV